MTSVVLARGRRRAISLLLVVALAGFAVVPHSGLEDRRVDRPPAKAVTSPSRVDGCLKVQPCAGAERVQVLDLVEKANRYDRRAVRVSGRAIMLKLRRGVCGEYQYFVLQDGQGHYVSVTDYRPRSEVLERKSVTVTGFYRAELHNIDVCEEVR